VSPLRSATPSLRRDTAGAFSPRHRAAQTAPILKPPRGQYWTRKGGRGCKRFDINLGEVALTTFAPTASPPVAIAEVAGLGVACGVVALDFEAVKRACAEKKPAILVRHETVTTDIEGMALASGILTATGGRTSHAAVVARQLGKVCLVACPHLQIDLAKRQCRFGETQVNEGEFLSLDGNSGAVYVGKLEPLTKYPEGALRVIASWRGSPA